MGQFDVKGRIEDRFHFGLEANLRNSTLPQEKYVDWIKHQLNNNHHPDQATATGRFPYEHKQRIILTDGKQSGIIFGSV
ncbi:hypothetical protein G7K_6914-t1 [Saitoella complicata NRRL Y-17804]|uniref:Uncharacterized protein n=1 Tax=Saitoella complicata (strain BCRC 22490 / CBS 7301 / JCM 7358 / NBRC 10748 / NRRL Y-17804) TaxID=698492 RepID=A0A0E9NSX0_SAICN|nr:hypothetical protein G7K_6914-t1 [Saitoella complicata NRRL Y-17804]